MKRSRAVLALTVTSAAIGVLSTGLTSAASAATTARTFSFIGKAGSKARTVLNFDGMLINARCDSQGNPVIYAFSSSSNADLFGRMFDGLDRVHIIRNSSFTKQSKGVLLTPTSGDFDGTGTVLFETYSGKVVTVDYAFDDSTTLGKRNVCTVYGSAVTS